MSRKVKVRRGSPQPDSEVRLHEKCQGPFEIFRPSNDFLKEHESEKAVAIRDFTFCF